MRDYQPQELIVRQLSTLPDSPGCYLFKDQDGEILYIGKAINLKSRVRSYFVEASWRERPKLAVMIPKVVSIETILVNSEKEALLLEANLIREKKPRYNVALKDDRRYPWLAITYDVAYPRLVMIRDPAQYKKNNPHSKVFGPYVEAGAMWETVKTLRKVFPMRQRHKPLFKDRPCMNYHIGLCLAPCQKLVQEETYNKMVKQVEMFLSGRQTEVMDEMTREMEALSEALEFEEAALIRDRLYALSTVIEKQQVFFQNRRVCQDIIAQAHTEKLLALCLMKVREGKLIASETVTLPLLDKTGWDEAFQAYICQYYTACEDIALPAEVLLAHEIEDIELLRDFLSQKAGVNVKVLVPQRGGKTDLIEMAQKNAQQALTRVLTEDSENDARVERILTALKEGLGIDRLPKRIECFDISNIQGTDNVASMVVFEGAKPKKSDYRMFKIKSVEGTPNDFASMKEAVGRRYARILAESKPFPDLIIIDGGKGQLGAAFEALTELGLTGPGFKTEKFAICGLAKRQEEVYFPGNSTPVFLPRRSEALLLLQHVRDEAHRFAVTYHRKLRAKRVVSSKLDSLKGLGAKRRKLLIDHFGSFEKIKKASLDEILALTKEGLPEKLARTIYDFVRQPGAVNLVAEGVAEAEAEGAEAADSETLALEEDGVLVFSEELDMDEENGAEENGEEESGEEESES
ncbi:MAG TPA: excinuclease ABC subunit UvrC [Candidatus Obscuribacter sp.]|nr:excinuclease ABC subunit UvrC [Candidatus Obscuribacter sp.]HNB15446.1 excinuclease ABC subunit UvrC [Candidatus Obscuribacter sp.]